MPPQIPTSPEIERIRAETRALSAALSCVEMGLTPEAQTAIEIVLPTIEAIEPEGVIIRCAMQRILRRAPDCGFLAPVRQTNAQYIFEAAGLAWIIWASGGPATEAYEALPVLPSAKTGQAISLMVLRPWVLAIKALLDQDTEEARRQFRRACELGGQHGTESNPVNQRTYAATFISVED